MVSHSPQSKFSLDLTFQALKRFHPPRAFIGLHVLLIPLPPGSKIFRWKKNDTVFLFNGIPKSNQTAQYAVLDIPIGNKDLQQCADAVMRLRAMWLHEEGREIHFEDNSGKSFTLLHPTPLSNSILTCKLFSDTAVRCRWRNSSNRNQSWNWNWWCVDAKPIFTPEWIFAYNQLRTW